MSAEAAQPEQDSTVTLLLEFPYEKNSGTQLASALNGLRAGIPLADPALSAWVATSAAVATCYLHGNTGDGNTGQAVMNELHRVITARLASIATGSIELSRLQKIAAHIGASHGESAPFHYVVRTDVEAGGEDELQRWYDEEHMAMLAAVPGTVRARRLISLDAKPRYYACYDLIAPEVLTSAEWLKVRQTQWSQRVRPMFRNTRRVVMRKLDLADPRGPDDAG
jgi:hypothetical protein